MARLFTAIGLAFGIILATLVVGSEATPPRNLSLVWQTDLPSQLPFGHVRTAGDVMVVYFTSTNKKNLVGLNATDGTILWSQNPDNGSFDWNAKSVLQTIPNVFGEPHFALQQNAKLCVYFARNGSSSWCLSRNISFYAASYQFIAALVIGEDSTSHELLVLHAKTGAVHWRHWSSSALTSVAFFAAGTAVVYTTVDSVSAFTVVDNVKHRWSRYSSEYAGLTIEPYGAASQEESANALLGFTQALSSTGGYFSVALASSDGSFLLNISSGAYNTIQQTIVSRDGRNLLMVAMDWGGDKQAQKAFSAIASQEKNGVRVRGGNNPPFTVSSFEVHSGQQVFSLTTDSYTGNLHQLADGSLFVYSSLPSILDQATGETLAVLQNYWEYDVYSQPWADDFGQFGYVTGYHSNSSTLVFHAGCVQLKP